MLVDNSGVATANGELFFHYMLVNSVLEEELSLPQLTQKDAGPVERGPSVVWYCMHSQAGAHTLSCNNGQNNHLHPCKWLLQQVWCLECLWSSNSLSEKEGLVHSWTMPSVSRRYNEAMQ